MSLLGDSKIDRNAFIPILVIKPYHPFDICIIYSHGNSGDIGTCLLEAVSLSLNTYCCVVSYEYPGYGECKDIPLNEENVYYNIIKTYEYARDILKFRPEHIVLYGFSLGTGISFDLATRPNFPIAGLILQAPFLSILIIALGIIFKTIYSRTLASSTRDIVFDLN